MPIIKVNVNGKEVEGVLVENVKCRRRKTTKKNKTYEWDECTVFLYIPKRLANRKLALVPID